MEIKIRGLKALPSLFILALGLSSSAPAEAWVHWNKLDDPTYKHQLLIFPMLREQKFTYCLQNESQHFDRDSLKFQVDRAIEVWGKAFEQLGATNLRAEEVARCDRANLQIVAGPNPFLSPPLSESSAFVTNSQKPTGPIYMHLNVAETTRITSYGDDLNLRILDIKDALNLTLTSLSSFLDRLNYQGYSLSDLLRDHPELVTNSRYLHLSFPIILHEFGHTFGLGDTYPTGIDSDNGSADWQSATQPTSLMQAAPIYNLENDDRIGLEQLIRRVRAEIANEDAIRAGQPPPPLAVPPPKETVPEEPARPPGPRRPRPGSRPAPRR